MQIVGPVRFKNRVLFLGRVPYALFDEPPGFGMQGQLNAQGLGRALAGVVVRRGANAARGKHDVARRARGGESACQRGNDAVRVVTDVLGVGQRQATRGQ